ncbi:MAG: putative cytokinetic ring protein SteA [Actinomycetota bacterium]|nr:putative cytokinetic ring protein SteA [Actinomycetota bacterium]
MVQTGRAMMDRRTKRLVKRLKASDIAVIDHIDLDKVTAEALLETGVKTVINASASISGKYPNLGPFLLASQEVNIIDNVGEEIFELALEGEEIRVEGERVILASGRTLEGEVLDKPAIEEKMEAARENISHEIDKFATNTLDYMKREKGLLHGGEEMPDSRIDFKDRHVLIVVRGYDYKADLIALRSYIREVRPILIGVDGGADALIQEGYKPDIIMGDMDSVADQTLEAGAELIVHAYRDGSAPGLKRLERMGLSAKTFAYAGTSEDIAMLFAFEKGAELIVAVGTHLNLVEFLDKGRAGMASTFLVRLKVGERLIDAKGVSRLYRSQVKPLHLMVLVASALTTAVVIITFSTSIRSLFRLIVLKLRIVFGY